MHVLPIKGRLNEVESLVFCNELFSFFATGFFNIFFNNLGKKNTIIFIL